MSGSTTPPGWYPAPGDPPGTHRYWNGTEWTTGPQPMQQMGIPSVGGAVAGVPAEWGTRALAWLIDYAPFLVGYLVVALAYVISDTLGALLYFVFAVGGLGYSIWNMFLLQGRTGQTIGKKRMNIKLVSDATGQPVGPGMAFVRYLIAGVLGICGIYILLDYLWPLWDADRKRLTDKIVKFSVVNN